MLRKSPADKRNAWPANDAGVVKKTPSACSLFGGGQMKDYQCEGTYTGDQVKRKNWGGKNFWTERTP